MRMEHDLYIGPRELAIGCCDRQPVIVCGLTLLLHNNMMVWSCDARGNIVSYRSVSIMSSESAQK
jgi:hypothetical protein